MLQLAKRLAFQRVAFPSQFLSHTKSTPPKSILRRTRKPWTRKPWTLIAALLLALALVASPTVSPSTALAQDGDMDFIDLILETEPDISDDFGADLEFWGTTYDGETSRYFKNGRFYISVDVADTVAYARGDTVVEDFYAEVDTQHVAGDVSNQLGLIFRYVDEDNFYFFAIGNDGYYALLKLEDNSWTNLVEWTESPDVVSGSAGRNRVAVLAEGAQFTLLANDVVVAEVEDNTFSSGEIALTAGSYERAGVEVSFDNFALWRLGAADDDDAGEQASPATPPEEETVPEDGGDGETLQSFLNELRNETPDYAEDFLEDEGGWDVFETENVLVEHDLGALFMTVSAPQRLGTSVYPRTVTDFYMEVDIEHYFGPIDAEAGVVFREVDVDNYYFYAISHDGFYSLWRKRAGEWDTLIEWTSSDLLETGDAAYNTIGVFARGERIALFANDNLLEETTDSAFSEGTIALVVGTFDDGDVDIAFDGVYIWDIEDLAAELPPAQRPVVEADPDAPAEPEPEPEADYDAEARLTEILGTPSTFYDDFRRNTDNWEVIDDGDYSFTYRQRALLGTLDITEWVAWSTLDQELTDFYVEADMSQTADIDDASYGWVFRQEDGEHFYQFSVSIYGTYSVWKSTADEWIELVEWTEDPAIITGLDAVNRVGVLAEGANLSMVVNGEVIATVVDDEFTTGPVGLALETFEEAGNEVLYDNVELWDLSR